MLGKLLKYEIKATARIFLPMFAAMLIFSCVNKLFIELNTFNSSLSAVAGISVFIYVLIIIATFALTIIVTIQRFHKNLLSDEGYLMFTLPVKPYMHIISKGLVSMLWSIVTTIFVFISIFILIINQKFLDGFNQFKSEFSEVLNKYIGGYLPVLTTEMILGIIISLIFGILMLYASITIGHLFSNHKILASFGTYLVLNVIIQIVDTIVLSILGISNQSSWIDEVKFPVEFFVYGLMPASLIIAAIFSALFFFAINYLFKKKLNLE